MAVDAGLGLAEFIRKVKKELTESDKDGSKLLVIEEIELNIQVGLSVDAKAGVNVQVLQLGAGGKRDDVHTVKLKLQPLLNHEQRVAELQRNPNWSTYVAQTVDATVKTISTNSKRDEF